MFIDIPLGFLCSSRTKVMHSKFLYIYIVSLYITGQPCTPYRVVDFIILQITLS